MICPEGYTVENENCEKEEETCKKKNTKVPGEGTENIEFNSYKNLKTWKKSITNFFRNSLRSTRSNDGDRPSDSKEHFEGKEVSPEQKWQSLGKVFRRQSFAEHCNKLANQQGESSSSQNKRLAIKKALSTYFGKNQKPTSSADEK